MDFRRFDEEYVSRLRQGDACIEKHFASYFGDLLLIKLRGRVRSRQLIEDISQETLLRVLRVVRSEGGIEQPSRLGAFVNSVCEKVLLELLRAETRQLPVGQDIPELLDETPGIEEQLLSEERMRDVRQVLDGLSETDRGILRMLFFEGKDHAEICRKLNLDRGYLRVVLHRAKSRFRDRFDRHERSRARAGSA